jgi:hypothetical protein
VQPKSRQRGGMVVVIQVSYHKEGIFLLMFTNVVRPQASQSITMNTFGIIQSVSFPSV